MLTFRATGCPNPDPYILWWKRQYSDVVFEDMMSYCTHVKDGTANQAQISQCCGSNISCRPTTCNAMTGWVRGMKHLIGISE